MIKQSLQFERVLRATFFILLLYVVGESKAVAQSITVGDLNYFVNNDSISVTLTGHVDGYNAIGTLVIPDTIFLGGNRYPVTSIDYSAFRYCSSLTGPLTIPNTVTSIHDNAFEGCSGFSGSLTIPNTVTEIGASAFLNCSGFTDVYFNAINCSDVYLSSYANPPFQNCGGNLYFGENVVRIPKNMFQNGAFTGSLTIPSSVTTIGESAFGNCSGFSGSFMIPNSVTTIGGYAFYGCNGFTGELIIPYSLTSIGEYAFGGCNGFTSVHYTGSITQWCNISFGSESSLPLYYAHNLYINGELLVNLSIPETITEIKPFAFCRASCITSLTIPNSVTEIGMCAFYQCSGLTGNLTIPNSVTLIGNQAFRDCNGFNGILTIPSSITVLDNNAFYNTGFSEVHYNATNCADGTDYYYSPFKGCHGTLIIGDGVERIPNYMFNQASFSGVLTIGHSVTSIGNYAFNNCNFWGISFTGTVAQWCNIDFISNPLTNAHHLYINNNLITDLVIPDSVSVVKYLSFSGANHVSSLTLPASLTEIESFAFSGCSGLTSISSFAETPPLINNNSFNNVNKDIPVMVPCNATNLYQNASGWDQFTNYIGNCPFTILTEANPADGGIVTGAGYYYGGTTCTLTATANEGFSFVDWTKDGIPVSSNANYSFIVTGDASYVANFEQGVNIIFADANVKALCVANWDTNGDGELSYFEAAAVTNLGQVFRNNSTITSFDELQYFTGLTSIEDYAFKSCTSLTSIAIPNSVTSIGSNTFCLCTDLTSIAIPNSVTSIQSFAFQLCTGLTSVVIPSSVTSIGTNPFISCSGLVQIIVDSGNPEYDSRESCNAIVKTSTNELVTGCYNTILLNSITSIGNYAFGGCSSLTSITIPSSVFSIGWNPFQNCSGLEQIIVDSGNSEYDSRENCNAIIKTTTNELVTGCMNTIIPYSVTSIGRDAFRGCAGLTSITIPNFVTSIQQFAFWDCTGLTSMTVFAEVPPSVVISAFYNVPKSIPVYVPSGTIEAYQNADGWNEFTNYIEMGTFLSAVICQGEDYLQNGFEIVQPAVGENEYSITLTSSLGLDSIVNLTLTVYPTYYFVEDTTVCNATSFQWHGNTYTESGIYYDTLQTVHDCDSIFQLSLELFNTPLGEFTFMTPTDNYPFTSLPITFSWDAVSGAEYYDLYVWNVDDPMPNEPYVSNLTGRNYSTSSLQNHQTYNWFVKARNTCYEVSSSVKSFSVDITPSLTINVDQIDYGEVTLNQSVATTLDVGGVVLEDTLNVQIVGDDAAMFSFTKASGWNDYTGGFLIVTFHPTVPQYSYNANLVISSGTLTATTSLTGGLADMYVFNTYVVENVYAMNSPIPIYGSLTDVNSIPVVNEEVEIGIFVMGMKRTLQAVTDESGQFSAVFEPMPSESGYYTVNSGRVGNHSTAVHDDFNIPGITLVSSDYILCAITQDQPKTDSILIRNKSNLNLNNIQVSPISVPDGASFSFMPLSLNGLEENWLIYTVNGSTLTQGNYYEEAKLKATSSEGAEMNISIWYYCIEPRGVLDVMPKSLATTMTKGKSKIVDVMLTNNGTAATGNITIDLPDVEWMSVVGNDTLSSIAVNDTAYFSLRFSPAEDIQLGQYLGTIAINSERGDAVALPYTITAVSDSTGSLMIDVTDDFTWNTNNGNGPHLEGAEVTLKGYYSLETVAYGFSDSDGHFSVEDLPEGYYRLSVTAERHTDYNSVVFVEAGATGRSYTNVYLQYQAITYSWVVEPTEIQDEYTYELDVVFETHVPAPVVVIDISSQVPELDYGESYTFNAIITNYGLITAKGFQLQVPVSHEYIFNALYDGVDSIPALTTVVIPVLVNRAQSDRDNNPYSDVDPCDFRLGARMYYVCGRDYEHNKDRYVWHNVYSREVFVNRCALNIIANSLPALPWFGGGGGHGNGNGSMGYADVPPQNSFNIGCHPCDNLLGNLASYGPINGVMDYVSGFVGGNHHGAKEDVEFWGERIPKVSRIVGLYKKGKFAGDLLAYIHCQADHSLGLRSQPLSLTDFNYIFRLNDDMISLYFEIYQDSTLYDKNSFGLLNSLLLPYFTNIVEISESDAFYIKSNFINLDIQAETIDSLICRWNNTANAWNACVFEPDLYHPQIMNRMYLDSIGNDIYEIYNDSYSLGYDSFYEMVEELWDILNNEINHTSNSVCSTVKVRFSQKMTMTREAFEGTFTVHNGHDIEPMEAIGLDFIIKDEDGNVCNNLFQINTLSLNNLTEIDGSGSLDASLDGVAKIQFIPTKYAAPTEPKVYYFGGTFSFIDPYTFDDITVDLYPVEITVNPSPDLYVDYFMQRDILGDDALTLDVVEPSVPAELGVIIHNQGAGMAKNVTLETAEPQIIDNEKGLAIDFAMYGASFNGSPRQLGLMEIPFGNIESGQTAVGEWLFTSSLLGHFISYEAHVIHNSSYGNPDLSLVSHLDIHELIHPIYAYGTLDDGINDFLVNDNPDAYDIPDSIYFSHGGKTSVDVVDGISFDHYVVPLDTIVTLTINPSRSGWNFGVTDDPGGDKYELVSCTRVFDNQVIPLNNVWQTFVTIPDGGDPVYENKLHFVDTLPDGNLVYTYTLVYQLKNNLLNVEEIIGIPESYIDYPLESFSVKFNKPIADSTFTFEDMTLKCNNGPNLMDSTIVITKVDESLFNVNLAGITNETGLFVLNINSLNINDTYGYSGYLGKQASWVQVLSSLPQSITLSNGWNWCSSYIGYDDNSLINIESQISNSGTDGLIKSQNAFTASNNNGPWAGSLDNLDNTQMYMILVDQGLTLMMNGMPVNPSNYPITLHPGWTWIGYLSNQVMGIDNALYNLNPTPNDLVKSQNAFASYHSELGWVGSLESFQPGKGYMYLNTLTENNIFNYPSTSKSAPVKTQTESYWETDFQRFQNNMVMMVTLDSEQFVLAEDSYEVGAFVNDECRGSARLRYVAGLDRYVAFLTVCGEAREDVAFKVYKIVTQETTERYALEHIDFNADIVVGSLDQPMVLHFENLGLLEDSPNDHIKLFPNPTNDKVTIIGEDIMSLTVANALGLVVLNKEYGQTKQVELSLGNLSAGVYTVTVSTSFGNHTVKLVLTK